jgi:hypothetical protein
MGFAAPDPDERVARDEAELATLVRVSLDFGASDDAVRRLFRLSADNLRRLATAEADLYVEELDRRWTGSGMPEAEVMRLGAQVGRRFADPVDVSIRAIYQRHRQHIWTEFSIQRAEMALVRVCSNASRRRRRSVSST